MNSQALKSKRNQVKQSFSEKSFFKLPDMFGRDMTFMCEEKISFRTLCGTICTFIVILVVGLISLSELLKLINQDLLSLSYYETRRENQQTEGFSLKVLELKDGYQPEHINIIISSPFNPTLDLNAHLYLSITNGSEHGTIIDCSAVVVQGAESIEGDKVCFNLNSNVLSSSDIQLKVSRCIDSKCLDSASIDALGSIPLEIYFEVDNNRIEDNFDSENTVMKKVKLPLNLSFKKEFTIELIELESITETGIQLKNYGFRTLVFKGLQESLISMASSDQELATINFTVDKQRKLYTYNILYRVGDLVSFLGGLMKGITMVAFAFVWPFREVIFYNFLVNEMFTVCDKPEGLKKVLHVSEDEDEEGTQRTSRNTKIRNSSLGEISGDPEIDDVELKRIIEKIEKMKDCIENGGLFCRLFSDEKKLHEKVDRELKRRSSIIKKYEKNLFNLFNKDLFKPSSNIYHN